MAKLSDWSKKVKVELINRDWKVSDLCDALAENGTPMTRSYVSAIINGRLYSETGVRNICSVLDIVQEGNTLKV